MLSETVEGRYAGCAPSATASSRRCVRSQTHDQPTASNVMWTDAP